MTMDNFLLEQFEANRARLTSVARRILGSRGEAEDAVQDLWLRLNRVDNARIENIGGWLTTVVGRLCLDALRARRARQEDSIERLEAESGGAGPVFAATGADPADEIAMADSVGLAMQAVLERLVPAERVAFVLHDLFAVPFEDIARIIGRSQEATRQLASRARRRVQGARADGGVDRARRREIVDAFLAASRGGDFAALLTLLDPEVVLTADPEAVRLGGQARARGAPRVAQLFSGKAQAARPAMVDGAVDIAVAPGGRLLLVLRLEMADGRIAAIHAVAEPAALLACDVVLLDDQPGAR
ncbi:sigma-70 family RNA polymerase sigma factor [Scleromatobacter humisilvae]|uniref:Sigma-70 family RNA polymerase sigma factor n=1 Tax=Scleromatobacter humisilvae TaxID=2897159 RepID=A0A9X2BZH1_9BURK|nr:sigma-70 family RNA polymerase sigma factor [Scleromatobacter humisilvae]MCK9685366.1 sigma-70 family RNA polymerase sigma factor [Scleromatobacter humisilvae]